MRESPQVSGGAVLRRRSSASTRPCRRRARPCAGTTGPGRSGRAARRRRRAGRSTSRHPVVRASARRARPAAPRRRRSRARPGASSPAPSTRAARQPPRVCAEKAARADRPLPGVRCAHRRAHRPPRVERGHRGVRARAPARRRRRRARRTGSWRAARSAPSRATYMPSGPPQRASKAGCTLATTAERGQRARSCSGVSISACSTRCRAARTRRQADLRRRPRRCRRARPSSAASPMAWKPACSPARVQAATCRATCSAVEVGVAAVSARRRTARTGRRCGCRARRRRTGRRRRRPRRARGPARRRRARPSSRSRSTPCSSASSARKSSSPPMSGPPHSWTQPMPSAAARSSVAVCAARRCAGRDRGVRGAAHDVVGLLPHQPVADEARRGPGLAAPRRAARWRRPRCARRCGRGRRRRRTTRGRARRPSAGAPRARWCRPSRCRAATPPRSGPGRRGDPVQRDGERRRAGEVEPGQRQAGGGGVHVRVDEGGRDPGVVEVDDDVGGQRVGGALSARPRRPVAVDEQGGRERVGRGAHPAAAVQRRRHAAAA